MQFTNPRNSALVLMALAIAPPSNASAQSETTQADLRCLVAIMESAALIDKAMPGSSAVAAMYYLGKVDADDPNLDLEAAMRDTISKMNSKDVGTEDMRCGLKLTERGQAMKTIGQHLSDDPTGKASDAGKGSATPGTKP
jgi:hypothetical protein